MIIRSPIVPASSAEIPTVLTIGQSFGWVVGGILISLILPLAVNVLRQSSTKLEGLEQAEPSLFSRFAAAWKKYGGPKYAGILLAAVVVAAAIIFLLGMKFYTERDAALAGFAWESLIHKVAGQQRNPPATP